MQRSDDVEWVRSPILDCLPDLVRTQSFTIMHITLVGIIAKDTVDDNNLLPARNQSNASWKGKVLVRTFL